MDPTDFDTPWKDTLDTFLPEFLDFHFPNIFRAIDWRAKFTSLNTELPHFAPSDKAPKRVADLAYQITLKNPAKLPLPPSNDSTACLLIHIEVQAQYDPHFPSRMFAYNYRFRDRQNGPVLSIAILADPNLNWRADTFHEAFLGQSLAFTFPIAKLTDLAHDLQALRQHQNPFATIALAQILHIQSRQSHRALKASKLDLTRLLLRKQWPRDTVANILKFLDWIFLLPEPLELEFINEIKQSEAHSIMPFLAPFEQIALKQGRNEGLQQGLANARDTLRLILEKRFGPISDTLAERIQSADLDTLKTWTANALDADSPEAIF